MFTVTTTTTTLFSCFSPLQPPSFSPSWLFPPFLSGEKKVCVSIPNRQTSLDSAAAVFPTPIQVGFLKKANIFYPRALRGPDKVAAAWRMCLYSRIRNVGALEAKRNSSWGNWDDKRGKSLPFFTFGEDEEVRSSSSRPAAPPPPPYGWSRGNFFLKDVESVI